MMRHPHLMEGGLRMYSCSRLNEFSPLSIQCRRCGSSEDDDLEVFEAGSIYSMRCSDCRTVAHFAFFECSRCCAETLFRWDSVPGSEELQDLVCAACARRYCDAADSAEQLA